VGAFLSSTHPRTTRASRARQDATLLHIAEAALCAPLPPGWTVHLDAAGNEYFCATASGGTSYEHPCDRHFRKVYRAAARARAAAAAAAPGGGA
jgi:hypothetical protein